MKDKKILFISTEVMPYRPESDISFKSFESAKLMHHKGIQTRIFMPRFGIVNERRHQLHEVIRLSGANLIINDFDMPLVIKVASVPKERMQVYFIDNDDYFKRKFVYTDAKGKLFDDNDERAIFFTKGVISTVKKLNWAPDIIHLNGWMTSLIPLYLKEYFKDDALFKDSKVVTSLYDDAFKGTINKDLQNKISFDGITKEKSVHMEKPDHISFQKIAIDYSDHVIYGSKDLSSTIKKYAEKTGKLALEYLPNEEISESYSDFFLNLIQ